MKKAQAGISLIEILIAVAILGVLLIALLFNIQPQMAKSRDAERKGDLEKIKVAFENYYNDNNCYPPASVLDTCGGSQLAPYLNEVPCDPATKTEYTYLPLADACSGYRLFAQLETESDPVIEELGCDGSCGCGYGPEYNYGYSTGTPLANQSCQPLASSQPTASSTPNPTAVPSASPQASIIPRTVYACDGQGQCNTYSEGHPNLLNCTSFPTVADCEANCYKLSPYVCAPN